MTNVYLLEQVDIFEDLNSDQLKLIDDVCDKKTYTKDEVIFDELIGLHWFDHRDDGCVQIDQLLTQ